MVIVAINSNGKAVGEAKLPSSTRALDDFFSTFDESVQTVVECTSSWYWCRDNGISLTLAHSKMVKAISYAKVKTDKVDAKTLAERLMAVLGLGNVGVWTILAEIGDITRFPTAKQFVSYCRLVPGASDSGGNYRHKSGNKDGNKYLRAAFGQAAIAGYTHYKPVKKFYQKIKRRSGRHVARAVVAKELAKGIWHMLTKDEEYKGFPQRDPLGKGAAGSGCLSNLLAAAYKPARLTGTISEPARLIGE